MSTRSRTSVGAQQPTVSKTFVKNRPLISNPSSCIRLICRFSQFKLQYHLHLRTRSLKVHQAMLQHRTIRSRTTRLMGPQAKFPKTRQTGNLGDSMSWRRLATLILTDTHRSRGYPAMCTFVASDDDFFVLRRFEKSGARVALRMQDRIAELEEYLATEDRKGREEISDCGTFRDEPRPRRRQILDEMTWRLKEYRGLKPWPSRDRSAILIRN